LVTIGSSQPIERYCRIHFVFRVEASREIMETWPNVNGKLQHTFPSEQKQIQGVCYCV
jgi:hypothetical protein